MFFNFPETEISEYTYFSKDLPENDYIENYEGADREENVKKSVQPQDVDVEVPVVAPHLPPHNLQVPMQTVSQELARSTNYAGVESLLSRLRAGGCQLKKLWKIEENRVENNRNNEVPGAVAISAKYL